MEPFLVLALMPIVGVVVVLLVFWIMNIKKDRKTRVRDHILVEEIEQWLRSLPKNKEKED